MIKGADRKENSKIIQFRAPSEYHCMIELIIQSLNKKISEVGSNEKITATDVIKLAIESLATGNNSFNILGNHIKINDLVNNELEYFKVIPKNIIEFEVKFSLIKKIEEIVKILEDMHIYTDLKKSSKEVDELKILKSIIFSREQAFDSMKASNEEKEMMGFVQIQSIEYYLDIIFEKYNELQLDVFEIDFELLKNEIEDNILKYSSFINMQALKLYDNYKYSFILHSLRKDINEYISYIEDYLTHKNNPFT